MEETLRDACKDSCKDIFKNTPNNTSEDSHETHSQRMESNPEDNVCLKASREDNIEVNSLTYNQMFKLNVQLSKVNDKLEKNIIDLKGDSQFLENRNKILGKEISSIRRESLISNKCESYESLKNGVPNLHETIEKFTKGKNKLDLILSSQRNSFNRNGVGYKPNRSLNNSCYDRKKYNHPIFKCKF